MTTALPAPGPLESLPSGRLAIEASAGTGKTFTLAGLATRFVAERGVSASELLIVTFTRAATDELRARCRQQMADAALALRNGTAASSADPVTAHLGRLDPPGGADRLERAVTEFDTATIATIHGFARQIRSSLGVTADVDVAARLVDDGAEVLEVVCADVLAEASARGVAETELPELRTLVAATGVAVSRPDLVIEPHAAEQGASTASLRLAGLVRSSVRAIGRHRRSAGTLSFDDLVLDLRRTLRDPAAAPAVAGLRQRYRVALIDEFQDTDPVQWEIVRDLFATSSTGSTLVLVGDPKQAIYRFRGADITTYLQAVGEEGTERRTLRTNWRSDGAVLRALGTLFTGVTFGDEAIAYVPVDPSERNKDRRMTGADGRPLPALELRVAAGSDLWGATGSRVRTPLAARAVERDLVDRVRHVLDEARIPTSGEDPTPRRVRPSDVAVLVQTRLQGASVREAFRRQGVPAIVAGEGSVLDSAAAGQVRLLLHAMLRPSDLRRVRGFALSWFVHWTPAQVAAADDRDLEVLQDRVARWAELLVHKPVAEVFRDIWAECAVVATALRLPDGDRAVTDLEHLAEFLHGAVPGGRTGAAGLLGLLDLPHRRDVDTESDVDTAARRVESDAGAVQIMTVWMAKGLEFPLVYLPMLWRPGRRDEPLVYTEPDGSERVFVVDPADPWPDEETAAGRRQLGLDESSGELYRLLYVACTRALHQVVVWWANAQGSPSTPLAHVLFARSGAELDPGRFARSSVPIPGDDEVVARLEALDVDGDGTVAVGHVPEVREARAPWRPPGAVPEPTPLGVARFERVLDRSVGRWSFSTVVDLARARSVDPYDTSVADGGAEDEAHEVGPAAAEGPSGPPVDEPAGRLVRLAAGTAFGTFVHGVLEQTDFTAPDLPGEIAAAVGRRLALRPFDLDALGGEDPHQAREDLVLGLRDALRTPLGPLWGGRCLAELPRTDRLDELAFDLHLGGDPHPSVRDIGRLLLAALDGGHPLVPWAEEVAAGALEVPLAGHLTGSLDLVARVTGDGPARRWLIADYKTNQLVPRGQAPRPGHYGPEALAGAMAEHHYPLQALFYAVALHRYLRARTPPGEAADDVTGVSYLFLRGMTGPTGSDGDASGVFGWELPTGLVPELSRLLAEGPGGAP